MIPIGIDDTQLVPYVHTRRYHLILVDTRAIPTRYHVIPTKALFGGALDSSNVLVSARIGKARKPSLVSLLSSFLESELMILEYGSVWVTQRSNFGKSAVEAPKQSLKYKELGIETSSLVAMSSTLSRFFTVTPHARALVAAGPPSTSHPRACRRRTRVLHRPRGRGYRGIMAVWLSRMRPRKYLDWDLRGFPHKL